MFYNDDFRQDMNYGYGDGIDININGTDDDSIIFYYYFYYGTTKYVYPIPFFGFGDANIPVLDAIYQTYHTIED